LTSTLTHLECGACGARHDADVLQNLCTACGKPLLARYDLEKAARTLRTGGREASLWRYREVLPVRDDAHVLRLGEGWTPLLHVARLGAEIGCPKLYVKDESLNPTTSFKARGMAAAISRAVELGAPGFVVPSAGNAASALAAYAARAGMEAHVFMPADVPGPFRVECKVLGAKVTLVDGLITDCARRAREVAAERGLFDVSTLREPYRVEGKKTLAYEVFEQLGGALPDVMIYPTGGGTGLVGMWKAFDEMQAMGWIDGRRPRMVCVQSAGCAPIVRAFEEGEQFAKPWENARTLADGLRVPAALGDFLILRALRESKGTALSIDDGEMIICAEMLGRHSGIFPAPEGAATLAALLRLAKDGWVSESETVVLFNTGSGLKYHALWAHD